MTDPDLRDPNLDRAYRETPRDEPPLEVDERIRAAARRAVGTRPQSLEQRAGDERRRSWTSRWRLPLSVAATVVIAATLTVMVQEEDRRPRDDAGRGAVRLDTAPREAEQPAAPAASSSDAAGDRLNQLPAAAPAQPPAPAPAPTAPSVQPSGRAALKSAVAPEVPSPSAPAPQPRREERAFPAQPPAAAEPAPAAPAELEMRRQSTAPAAAPPPTASPPLAAPAPAPAPPPAAASAPAPALQSVPAPRPSAKAIQEMAPAGAASGSLRRDRNLGDRPDRASREASTSAVRSPEAWVEYIRSLRAQGRETEATAELADLRRAYPDFKLSTDLGGPGQ